MNRKKAIQTQASVEAAVNKTGGAQILPCNKELTELMACLVANEDYTKCRMQEVALEQCSATSDVDALNRRKTMRKRVVMQMVGTMTKWRTFAVKSAKQLR